MSNHPKSMKQRKVPKKKAKTPQQLRKEALATLQKLVRLKAADDKGYCTCVTCGVVKRWNEGIQGGHFIPKGSSSYWSLEEENIHPQCMSCNQFGMKHGDAAQRYTIYMQEMYGKDFVDQMLADAKKPKKLYSADYRDMIEEWKDQIKEQLKRIGD